MEKCVVLSDGDKLREIRKKYHVKQEDIAGEEITRNLISEIENNKAPITKKTAEIIIKNLTVLAKKRQFEVDETVDYLMENQIVQANKALDNYIEELNTLSISKGDSFIKTLKEAESFLIDWDIKDKKLNIYEIAGDYYCNNNEMCQSAVYYEKASALLSRMFLDRKLLSLSRKLSTVYGRIGDYNKSIECCEFALRQFEDMSLKDKVIFRYNNALNYFNIKNFEKALNNLKIAESLVDKNDSMYIKILNNRATCLYKINKKHEALEVFKRILNLTNTGDVEKFLVILTNIVDVYIDINMKDKAIENLDIIINQLSNLNENSLCAPNIYFDIGEIYEKLNKIDVSESYYLKALSFCEIQKNYFLANNILYALVDMYMIQNNVKKMEFIKKKVFYIINKQDKVDDRLMYKLMIFYNKVNSEVSTQIGSFALNFK